LLGPGDIILFGVVCAVTGFGLGADLALPPALQADVVDLDVARSGRNRAGLLFALWGMASKFALAAAVGITFPVLGFFGFEARDPSPQGIVALAVIYSLVPVVLKLFAIAVMWNFQAHTAKHDQPPILHAMTEGKHD
jgi:glycoside/pentoside/hexuronide:cation symporter, GPH family